MIENKLRTFFNQMPEYKRYANALATDLPFVQENENGRHYWDFSVSSDLGLFEQFAVGYEFAAHLARFAHVNGPSPESMNILLKVVQSMENTDSRFVEGFMNYVQSALVARSQEIDVYEDLRDGQEAIIRQETP